MSLNQSGHNKIRRELRNRRVSYKKNSKEEKKNKKKKDDQILGNVHSFVNQKREAESLEDVMTPNVEESQKIRSVALSNDPSDSDEEKATTSQIQEFEPSHSQDIYGNPINQVQIDTKRKEKKKKRKHQLEVAADVHAKPAKVQSTSQILEFEPSHSQDIHGNSISQVEIDTKRKEKKKKRKHQLEVAADVHAKPNKVQRFNGIYTDSENDDSEIQVQGRSFTPPPYYESFLIPAGSTENLDRHVEKNLALSGESKGETEYYDAGTLNIKNMKRQIKHLEKHEIKINKKIDAMASDLNEIKEILRFEYIPTTVQDTAKKTSLLPQFPLKKLNSVYDMEKNIHQAKEYKQQLGYKVSSIGGKTIKKMVIRVFKRLFSAKLRTKMCWNGTKQGKVEFKNFEGILEVLQLAVGCTEDELENECKLRFNQAQKDYDREKQKKSLDRLNQLK